MFLPMVTFGCELDARTGFCARSAYELALVNKRTNTQECNNIQNWQQYKSGAVESAV